MKPDQPYIVFEQGDEYNRERWFVVESKAAAIQVLVYGYAANIHPISQETYNEYKKLEEIISTAQWKMYELEKPFHDAILSDQTFFDDPEYRKVYEFAEMWREAHRMNLQFDYEKKYGIQEPDEPIAEWERELLAAATNKETE